MNSETFTSCAAVGETIEIIELVQIQDVCDTLGVVPNYLVLFEVPNQGSGHYPSVAAEA